MGMETFVLPTLRVAMTKKRQLGRLFSLVLCILLPQIPLICTLHSIIFQKTTVFLFNLCLLYLFSNLLAMPSLEKEDRERLRWRLLKMKMTDWSHSWNPNQLFCEKANELFTFCDAEILFICFSLTGKPFSFSHPSIYQFVVVC